MLGGSRPSAPEKWCCLSTAQTEKSTLTWLTSARRSTACCMSPVIGSQRVALPKLCEATAVPWPPRDRYLAACSLGRIDECLIDERVCAGETMVCRTGTALDHADLVFVGMIQRRSSPDNHSLLYRTHALVDQALVDPSK